MCTNCVNLRRQTHQSFDHLAATKENLQTFPAWSCIAPIIEYVKSADLKLAIERPTLSETAQSDSNQVRCLSLLFSI